jgi:hypothetical protein
MFVVACRVMPNKTRLDLFIIYKYSMLSGRRTGKCIHEKQTVDQTRTIAITEKIH